MSGFVGCIPRFLKAHGGWVLTILGVAGVGGTAYLAAKETPKAMQAVKDADDEKYERWMAENVYPDESLDPEDFDAQMAENLEKAGEYPGLTRWERIKAAAPCYIPAILTGAVTGGCMIGAQLFNMKQQAMLIGAYATLGTQFDQYREAIKAEHGEEADKRALEFSRKRVQDLQEEIRRLKEENGPYLYGITTLPGVIFEAKPVDMQEAIYHFNRNLVLVGEANFEELYSFIGISNDAYSEGLAASFGYNEYINEVNYGVRCADFQIVSVFSKNGRMVHMIDPAITPYRIDSCNTDCDWDENNPDEYPGYDEVRKRAIELAQSVLDSKDLTKIIHPDIVYDNMYFCGRENPHELVY